MNHPTLQPGDPAPDFTLPAHTGGTIHLADLAGKAVVLYFYPKDDTSGCTLEGKDFAQFYPQFSAAGAEILGVSRDSVESHRSFAQKYGFPFPLLADGDEQVCQAYDVIKEKNMYGRITLGIERSTFVIDRLGRIAHIERKVKVDGHAAKMLDIIQHLP